MCDYYYFTSRRNWSIIVLIQGDYIMADWEKLLNPEQLKAVKDTEGAVLGGERGRGD